MTFKPEYKVVTFPRGKSVAIAAEFNTEMRKNGSITLAFYKKAFGAVDTVNPVDHKWGWKPGALVTTRPYDIRFDEYPQDAVFLDLGELVELGAVEKKIVDARGNPVSKEKEGTLIGLEIPDNLVTWAIEEVGKLLKRDGYYTNADMKLIVGMKPSLLDKEFGYTTFPTFVSLAAIEGKSYNKLVMPPVADMRKIKVSSSAVEKDSIKKFENHMMSESLIYPRLAKLKVRIQNYGFISLKYMLEVLDRDGTDDDAMFTWSHIDESWIVERESPQKGVRYFSFKIPEKSAFHYTAGTPWYPREWFMTENASFALRGKFKDLIAKTGCITIADFKLEIGYATEAEDHNWGWFSTGSFGYSLRAMGNVRPGAAPMVKVVPLGPVKLGEHARKLQPLYIDPYFSYNLFNGRRGSGKSLFAAAEMEQLIKSGFYNQLKFSSSTIDEWLDVRVHSWLDKQSTGNGKAEVDWAATPPDVKELAVNLDHSDTALWIARDALDIENDEEPYELLIKGASEDHKSIIRAYVAALKLAFQLAGPALDAIEEEEDDDDGD